MAYKKVIVKGIVERIEDKTKENYVLPLIILTIREVGTTDTTGEKKFNDEMYEMNVYQKDHINALKIGDKIEATCGLFSKLVDNGKVKYSILKLRVWDIKKL